MPPATPEQPAQPQMPEDPRNEQNVAEGIPAVIPPTGPESHITEYEAQVLGPLTEADEERAARAADALRRAVGGF